MSDSAAQPTLLSPPLAWLPILVLILLSLACTLGGAGAVLNLAFPAAAFAIALWLQWRYPLMYISFTWWLYFLTPWVRRMADLHGAGWTDPSPILLAPLLAALVSGGTFIQCPRHRTSGLPFVFCIASVGYALLVGLLFNSPADAILAAIEWAAPVFFGFHLFTHWRQYPAYRQMLQRTFCWGTLVMGVYGVVQYLVAPKWDQVWMTNALIHNGLNSIGNPEPLAIRVFSTMNAPQPFAAVMMAGLLMLLTMPSPWQPLIGGVGLIAFLLSLARSAWLAVIIGVIILIPSLKSSLQIRMAGSLLVLSLVIIPITQMEPFTSTILPRIQGLGDTTEDNSVQDRTEGYQRLFGQAFSDITGRGLGFVIEDESIGSRDSGILTIWFSLGWIGAVPYVLGLGLLLSSLFTTTVSQVDAFASAARAIAVATFVQISLNIVTTGALGMVLWGFVGIGLAARQHHAAQATQLMRPDVVYGVRLEPSVDAYR